MDFPVYAPNIFLINCVEPVGSQITCNPPPPLSESDFDWIVYVHKLDFEKFDKQMYDDKWQCGGSKPEDMDIANGSFYSYTKVVGEVNHNIVATADYNFYMKFVRATVLAKKYNLLRKCDRIELFQAILYGK